MGLTDYKRKRDFKRTSEPKGGKPKPKTVRGASRFVIQKHDARRLHYDLKSWAVPKGLPWKQGEKHLAVEVEDHPIDYVEFEGVIPEGQYGGGTVMVWDRGKYFAYGEQPLKSLQDGKNQWLILKTGSSAKPLSKKREDESVKSGRTMKQIAEDRDAEWESNREEKDQSATSTLKARIKAALVKKDLPKTKILGQASRLVNRRNGSRMGRSTTPIVDLPSAKPRFIQPMKPRLLEKPPTAGDWMYELKFDGIRAIAVKIDKKVSLLSRNENELARRFPEIVEAIKNLPARECVIDGEVVALDDEGRSSFQLLQALELEGRKSPVRFYVFDLLQLDGKSLINLPLGQRKELLAKLCEGVADPIRFSGEIGSDATKLLAEVKRRGLEGLIGKHRNSLYEPGRRSGAWIKLKCVNEQEFVIGGYTPPQGSRKYFGAILVGYYRDKKLFFAGKVGTGFTAKSLSMLHETFEAEERDDCPFVDLPSRITPSMMRKMHWVNPIFVAQIKFSEWTRDGRLRQPVFLGLREDKNPRAVTQQG